MNIAMKIPQFFFSVIAWLFLFLFFFHCWCDFFSSDNHFIHGTVNASPRTLRHRKVLLSNAILTPFTSRHRHHRRRMSRHHPEPTSSEIDPLYGVEKRLVPTGPNPLHH
ncbi:CLAVATA3/ESR (CLE)-related protein [Salix suchowensis]|nr:CLAVATA3/ESR (CLE)-related protein [Salix suchowensis]